MPKIVDHEERREFLAAISAELIAEQGLERATIREIAARTGFGRPADVSLLLNLSPGRNAAGKA